MQRYRIGRAPTNDIVVTEQTVSREHAELRELGDGRFSIKDLGSTYGTAVLQGEQWTAVTEAELKLESRLRLGEFETSVAELLGEADRTVVPGKMAATPPPAPRPPRTAAPTEVPAAPPQPPRPARTAAPTEVPAATPQPPRPAHKPAPIPAAPRRAAARFLRDMPKDKRVLVMLAGGFGVFLLISLIVLVLALALG